MNNYWNDSGKYQKEFEMLFALHVPMSGNSNTLAGELVRAANKLTYDFYNNGMGNNTSGAINFLFHHDVVDNTLHKTIHHYTTGRIYNGDYGEDELHTAMVTMMDKTIEKILNEPQLEAIPNTRDIFDFSDEDYDA